MPIWSPIRSLSLPRFRVDECMRARASLRVTDSISEVLKRWHTYIHTHADTKSCTRIRWCGDDDDDDDVYSAVCITHSTIMKWCVCASAMRVCLFDYFRCCSACLIKDRVFCLSTFNTRCMWLIIVSVVDNYIRFSFLGRTRSNSNSSKIRCGHCAWINRKSLSLAVSSTHIASVIKIKRYNDFTWRLACSREMYVCVCIRKCVCDRNSQLHTFCSLSREHKLTF